MCRRTFLFRIGVVVSLVLIVGLAGGLWGRFGRPPVAVPPEPTVEELLVGRWWYVERFADLPAEGEFNYRADGTVRIEVWFNGEGPMPQEGIYRIEGNRIYHKVHNPHSVFNPNREWRDVLISVDRQQLVVFTEELDRRTVVFQRLADQ